MRERHCWMRSIACLLFLECASLAAAAPLELVLDINEGADPRADSTPRGFVRLGELTLFAADDGIHGCELWRSDGSEAGTALVADLRPGAEGSCPDGFTYQMVVFGGRAFLVAGRQFSGIALWETDGSGEGTRLVADLGGHSDAYLGFASERGLIFSVYDADTVATDVWISDGSQAGTRRLLAGRLASGVGAAGDAFLKLNFDDRLWRSDGTPEGTQPIEGLPPVGYEFVLFRGRIWFSGTDDLGSELWSLDPANNSAERLLDLVPGAAGSYPGAMTAIGDRLVFFAAASSAGSRIWATDGSAAGTRRIDPPEEEETLYPYAPVAGATQVYFIGAGSFELWRSDGTAEGTVKLRRFEQEPTFDQGLYAMSPVGTGIFFGATTLGIGAELWYSDGTPAGTHLVRDVRPGVGGGSAYGAMIDAGGYALFTANDGIHGAELWRSDGTAAGTRLAADINRGRPDSSPDALTRLGATLLFSAHDAEHGRELWASDGTAAGTRPVADIYPGPGSGLSLEMATVTLSRQISVAAGRAYFSADSPAAGIELWTTDGSATGTHLVRELVDGPHSSFVYAQHGLADGLLFSAAEGPGQLRLYSSDGTAAGTIPVSPDLAVSAIGGDSSQAFVSGWQSGWGLWRFDPPSQLSPLGAFEFAPENLVAAEDVLYFTVDAPYFGSPYGDEAALWSTDGTPDGTTKRATYRSICPIAQLRLYSLTPFRGRLYFVPQGAYTGAELWAWDPVRGSSVVADLYPGRVDDECRTPNSSWPQELTEVNGSMYFSARDAEHGVELWRTNGTGANLVKDIRPGTAGSYPEGLAEADGILLFSAEDGEAGRELWLSDGTSAGTRPVEDLAAGPSSSYPWQITRVGDQIFVAAEDGVHGRELWRLPRAALPLAPADPGGAAGAGVSRGLPQRGRGGGGRSDPCRPPAPHFG